MKAGDIYLIQFDPAIGDEIQKQRPAVVIQEAPYRNTVIILPVSSRPYASQRFEVLIPKDEKNRLYKDSVVILDQVKSFDRSRLIGHIGCLSSDQLAKIKTKFIELIRT